MESPLTTQDLVIVIPSVQLLCKYIREQIDVQDEIFSSLNVIENFTYRKCFEIKNKQINYNSPAYVFFYSYYIGIIFNDF